MNHKILICDDDPLFCKALEISLRPYGAVTSVHQTDQALQILGQKNYDLLILDIQLRTKDEGLRSLPRLRELDPDLSILVVSGLKDFKTVREAMKLGASDYICKDFEPEELHLAIDRILEKKNLNLNNRNLKREALTLQKQYPLIGESAALMRVKKLIEKFRDQSANVLITGESGSGKEIVAKHLRKDPKDQALEPFVAVDSATLHTGTAESILFGHTKGAFTGADTNKKGLFEEAHGGVLFFDEIGNMPMAIQAKLLRVLQEKEITRMGSNRILQLDFRVIAATNKNLDQLAAKGEFLPDLIQRINILPIEVPALRDRIEDIPELVAYFLSRKTKSSISISPEVIAVFQSYFWPGNVRELSAMLDYSIAMMEGSTMDVADLHPKLFDKTLKTDASNIEKSFYKQMEVHEKKILESEYQKGAGNISKMALALGMDRSHLHAKLKLHGIHGKTN